MSEQQGPVAPADARDSKGTHEGVHPVLVNPDQPTFPHPVGVDRQALVDAGVGHGYSVPGGQEPESAAEETGAGDATVPEGKPADPDAAAKERQLAQVAATQRVGSPQGQQQ